MRAYVWLRLFNENSIIEWLLLLFVVVCRSFWMKLINLWWEIFIVVGVCYCFFSRTERENMKSWWRKNISNDILSRLSFSLPPPPPFFTTSLFITTHLLESIDFENWRGRYLWKVTSSRLCNFHTLRWLLTRYLLFSHIVIADTATRRRIKKKQIISKWRRIHSSNKIFVNSIILCFEFFHAVVFNFFYPFVVAEDSFFK